MNILRHSIAAIGFALAGFAASAEIAYANPLYARVEAGTATSTDVAAYGHSFSMPDGITYGAYVGTSAGPLRIEAGASRVSINVLDIATLHAMDYNATAYADFNLTPDTSIYVGAGPDYITAEASAVVFAADTQGWGYHATAGIAHRLAPGMIGEVAIRYVDSPDIDATTTAVTAGLRFKL